ncbi:uncharacterized protein LOC135346869 isoform X1 [Halichondria panicea]|uniref:uncharacterized protein LOC135346869 isoform X1 n=1 Tax=Halichondria panicea TaxID=6063 RepID=UPI00312BB90A
MATIKEAPTLYVTVPNGYPTERQQPFNYSQQLLQTNLLSPTTAAAMANKFEKEEKFEYDSNTDSDSECNNSKSRSGSNSPTAEFEERVFNDTTGRSGGPNAPDYLQCFNCERTCNLDIVIYSCGHRILLCNNCMPTYYNNCPWHPQSPWTKIISDFK